MAEATQRCAVASASPISVLQDRRKSSRQFPNVKLPEPGAKTEGGNKMLSGWIRPVGQTLALVFALTGAVAETAAADTREGSAMTSIHVLVDDAVLSATLDDTPAGRDFAALLPLELTLTDYHGIEKVADLPRELDTTGAPASYKPETGDITLYAPWGNLAIFYKPFQRSRGLVRLGAFDGSIEALIRKGDIPVRIEMAD